MTAPGWYARGPRGAGITSSTSAPSGDPGTGANSLHVNTTTGDLFRWNGTAWESAGNIKGPANTLSVGTVTTGAPGSSASLSITGTAPNQTLSATIPRGDVGQPNSLAIGTVTTGPAGSSASASITGTAPSQSLSLVIPRGDASTVPGPANVLTIGTVTTGTAAASITGTSPSQTLNLTLPTAAPNSLAIGTVTTGAPGSSASATITGSAPSQTLNLTIPEGDKGDPGDDGEVSQAMLDAAVAALVDAAPASLDTLNELAAALGDDPNFATTVATSIGLKADKARTITAGTGLTGGGDLTADRSLAVSYGTTAGTAAQGNDSRITGATPTSRTISTTNGLTGGGNLTANRTISPTYGTAANTICQGNDARLSDARSALGPTVESTASSGTPTPAIASASHQYNLTALAANATFGAPTGTPVDGGALMLRVKDNGTARTLAFNAAFRALGVTLPTTTTANKTLYIGCRRNDADSCWDVLAVGVQA
ncbi:hypothetical protein [Tsukamurella tyrosinosolvens]|uniref:hypothetical protein n=1 Tax=Tsukamurella tyrosinosolvens TaxID=57704 RepID=UPI002DD4402A|nr:hypothetical protein [Tsukamurella tyrosinosolvens]MEC4616178.1 hypothetical protein [Tsukamurella tyrosinosolvens]